MYQISATTGVVGYVAPNNGAHVTGTIRFPRMKFPACAGTTGALLGDFIPCKRDKDGAIGMYSVVKEIFFEL